ncbi:TonB-dependent receptor domain-containing protein [Porphyromonas sp.]
MSDPILVLSLFPKYSVGYPLLLRVAHAYLTISRGVKTGGFNEQSFSDLITTAEQQALRGQQVDPASIPSATTYKPEQSWSYELGARYTVPEEGFDLSSSLYWMPPLFFPAHGAYRKPRSSDAPHAL